MADQAGPTDQAGLTDRAGSSESDDHVEQVDVVVIGLGVGGEETAGRLAEAGLRVVGVEDRLVGGECPYWGCIPSKMMIRAADLLAEGRRVDGMAGHPVIVPDWRPVAQRLAGEATDNWNDKVAAERFTGKGGILVRGRGRLDGRGPDGAVRVDVEGRRFEARRGVVLAVGTEPAVPPIEGLANTPFWTNREALEAKYAPRSLIVLGGGAIGLELAQVFARFETEVTVVEAADRLLPMEEPEASDLIRRELEADGISVRTGARVVGVEHGNHGFTATLEDGGELTATELLVTVGRRANLRRLGLDSVGLSADVRAIAIDGHMRVGESIWAVGDVTEHGGFTHMAMYQAGIAIRDILGQEGPPAEYHAVPRVTFTDPEVGAVGMTEAQARDAGINVRTAMTDIPSSPRGWIHKVGNSGLVKLVADADRGVLVGATSAGPTGGEVLSMLTLAVHAEIPIERLGQMIYAYPTFHRAIEAALHSWT